MANLVQIEPLIPDPEKAQALLGGWLADLEKSGPMIDTTLAALNQGIGGLGGLVVMGGPPGCGKTALAVQIALGHTKGGGPCVYLGFEEGPRGFFSKLMQRETGISRKDQAQAIQGKLGAALADEYGSPTPDSIKGAMDAAIEARQNLILRGLPKREKDPQAAPAGLDMQELIGLVNDLQSDTGKPCLVVVDSLHYTPLGAQGAGLDGKRAVDMALHMFTELQQETGACVLMIGHQTKAEAKAKDGSLMAFSGSGTIAYAVDMAIQLQRATDESGQDHIPDEKGNVGLEIRVPKNRLGAAFSAPIITTFNLHKQTLG